MEGGGGDIGRLPEECVSQVISRTSPRDSCRCSAVSVAIHAAADSDAVWNRFLPSDLPSILSRADDPPPENIAKKDLYFLLCDHPILVDGGAMSFGLERSSGGKCFMLSARSLSIAWGDGSEYWTWISHPDSRFTEVAKLLAVCWFDIRGKIESRLLSRNTTYAAYLVFKVSRYNYGFTYWPQKTTVSLGAHVSRHTVCLVPEGDEVALEDEEEASDSDEDVSEEALTPPIGEEEVPNDNEEAQNGEEEAPNRYEEVSNNDEEVSNSDEEAPNYDEDSEEEAPSDNAKAHNVEKEAPDDDENSEEEAPDDDENSEEEAPDDDENIEEEAPDDDENSEEEAPDDDENSEEEAPDDDENSEEEALSGNAEIPNNEEEATDDEEEAEEGAMNNVRHSTRRDDGWMEMELGDFYNEEGEDGEVEMTLREVIGGQWKSGLIIQGIEVRPKT